MPTSVKCNNTQGVLVKFQPKNSAGGDATVDGALTGEVVSGDGTTGPDPRVPPDPLVVAFYSGANSIDDLEFSAVGDADLGSGVVAIREQVLMRVEPDAAVSFAGTVVATVDKPPAP